MATNKDFWTWLNSCPVKYEIDDLNGFDGVSVAFYPPREYDREELIELLFDDDIDSTWSTFEALTNEELLQLATDRGLIEDAHQEHTE